MIQARSHPSSSVATIEPRSNYFASETHYKSLARRIVAVLSSGGFILVIGDPPADPQVLSQALGHAVGSRYAVIGIPCGPELRGEDLERAVPISTSPLFVFDDLDRLSDHQIEEVCEGVLRANELRAVAVLLAPLGFLARLERPALRFLKERLAAQFRVQEVGDDEAIAFFHNQLLTQRDRRSETRGFRRGILIGLAGCGVLAASTGTFVVLHVTAEQVCPAPSSAAESSPPGNLDRVSALGPVEALPPPTAAHLGATAASVTASPLPPEPLLPPAEPDILGGAAPPTATDPPGASRLSDSDIAMLVVRGDGFLSAGDVTSARLFYERAVDAGDGLAALQLGATFDPAMLSRAGLRGVSADPARALSWYRRARELGASEAEHRIKALQIWPRPNDAR